MKKAEQHNCKLGLGSQTSGSESQLYNLPSPNNGPAVFCASVPHMQNVNNKCYLLELFVFKFCFNSHIRHNSHPFKICNSMTLVQSCTTIIMISFRIFSSPPKETHILQQSFPFSHSPRQTLYGFAYAWHFMSMQYVYDCLLSFSKMLSR